MGFEHLHGLRKVYREEGFWQAVKYDIDKSSLRNLIPYPSELIPGALAYHNYKTLKNEAKIRGDGDLTALLLKLSVASASIGTEAARILATQFTYNETGSLKYAALAYLVTSLFSFRNFLKRDRFYRPSQSDLTDRIE